METIGQCLDKRIEYDSSPDSDNNSTITSDSTSSPPQKLRRLYEFNTAKELQELRSVATEVLELKDYAQWFLSRSQHNVDDILNPVYYSEWFSTLGTVAKENVSVSPYCYAIWFDFTVVRGEPLHVNEREIKEHKIKKYGELALAHFNKTRDSSESYEYWWLSEIFEFEEVAHLNFYARLKVSESRPEPGPEQLFFAEVLKQTQVSTCCILDSEVIRTYDTLQILSVLNAWNSTMYAVLVVHVMMNE